MQLYETDHARWAMEQATLLRTGQLSTLDIDHLADELESIMGNERRELQRRFRILIAHLLKWKYQPEQRSKSWQATIQIQRDDIEDLLTESPSLRRFVPEKIETAYPKAVALASTETGLEKAGFPEECPFSEEELLNAAFWPDPESR